MSYEIELIDPVSLEVLELDTPHFMTGGTYRVGGDKRLRLNVTYNYAKHFYRVFGEDGIRKLYEMSGAESIPVLTHAIDSLNDDVDDNDYWNPTEGNAKRALLQLKAMATMRPDGVWRGD